MEHARIVAGLMLCDLAFLLKDRDLVAGIPFQQPVSGRQPYDSSANDRNVRLLHVRSDASGRVAKSSEAIPLDRGGILANLRSFDRNSAGKSELKFEVGKRFQDLVSGCKV